MTWLKAEEVLHLQVMTLAEKVQEAEDTPSVIHAVVPQAARQPHQCHMHLQIFLNLSIIISNVILHIIIIIVFVIICILILIIFVTLSDTQIHFVAIAPLSSYGGRSQCAIPAWSNPWFCSPRATPTSATYTCRF